MQEKQRFHDTFLLMLLNDIDAARPRERHVVLQFLVERQIPFRTAVVQNRPSKIVFQKVHISKIIEQFAVGERLVGRDAFITRRRLVQRLVQRLRGFRFLAIARQLQSFREELLRLLTETAPLAFRQRFALPMNHDGR